MRTSEWGQSHLRDDLPAGDRGLGRSSNGIIVSRVNADRLDRLASALPNRYLRQLHLPSPS